MPHGLPPPRAGRLRSLLATPARIRERKEKERREEEIKDEEKGGGVEERISVRGTQ